MELSLESVQTNGFLLGLGGQVQISHREMKSLAAYVHVGLLFDTLRESLVPVNHFQRLNEK